MGQYATQWGERTPVYENPTHEQLKLCLQRRNDARGLIDAHDRVVLWNGVGTHGDIAEEFNLKIRIGFYVLYHRPFAVPMPPMPPFPSIAIAAFTTTPSAEVYHKLYNHPEIRQMLGDWYEEAFKEAEKRYNFLPKAA